MLVVANCDDKLQWRHNRVWDLSVYAAWCWLSAGSGKLWATQQHQLALFLTTCYIWAWHLCPLSAMPPVLSSFTVFPDNDDQVLDSEDEEETILTEGCLLLRSYQKPNYVKVQRTLEDKYQCKVSYDKLQNCFLGILKPWKVAQTKKQLLSVNEKKVLVDWIIFLADIGHPVDKRLIQKKLYNMMGKKPSRSWIQLCVFWHPKTLKFGRPSELDQKWAQAFNHPVMEHCLYKLHEIIQDKCIPIYNIFNFDEKGCQHGGGRKSNGRKYFIPCVQQPAYLVKNANLELVTCLHCVPADGTALCPGFVFWGGGKQCAESGTKLTRKYGQCRHFSLERWWFLPLHSMYKHLQKWLDWWSAMLGVVQEKFSPSGAHMKHIWRSNSSHLQQTWITWDIRAPWANNSKWCDTVLLTTTHNP